MKHDYVLSFITPGLDTMHDTTTREPYCRPLNAGLASEPSAVAKRIGKLLDAIDHLNGYIVEGAIRDDLDAFRRSLIDRLEAEGWTVSATNGRLEGTNNMHVYPPGSPSGEKIRKWRTQR